MSARVPASCDPWNDADPSDGWDMVVIRRHGAPPLRFAGRALCGGRDGDLAVRIWRAKAGGFILAHSVELPGAETASRHARGEDVMLALEAYCRELEATVDRPVEPEASRRLHIADLLEEMARRADRRRRFRILAGETLDAFEAQHAGGIE